MTYVIKITPEMKRQFHSEVLEHLKLLEKMLMLIEKDISNHEAIHAAFRAVHSIKGNSDYLGSRDINALAHELEDLDMNRRVLDEDYEESDISAIQARIQKIRTVGETSPAEVSDAGTSEFLADVLEQEVKIGIDKIDDLVNLSAEFTITKNTLRYLISEMTSQGIAPKWTGALKKVSAGMNRIGDTLQADVMKMRLIKTDTLFERLPRIVRELSLKSNKKVDIFLSGGELEIERKTIEQLIDPLIHLIRNAVDHGIESPAERTEKGKPDTGLITVSSHQEGNYAVIDITDDGNGFDAEEIRDAALKKQIDTQDALMSMSDEEVINLTFMPGFSTNPRATELSGRGVGLDVVRNNIRMLGGMITLSGQQGMGARARLRIPVTMYILMPDMDGMDVVRKIMEADPDAKAIICSTDKQKFRRKRPGRSALWDSFPNQLTRIPCSDF
ncbi:MAG: hypothetical protein B6245_24205 [Desulfobacteraceae bacterium 4572_88]|nr:MAG: hypothetical protein B6245_24205 [Desulfobacteraceae bacterium 4572_88]